LLAFQRGGRSHRDAPGVINDLGRDVLVRAIDRQTQATAAHRLQAATGALCAALGVLVRRDSHDLLLLAFLTTDMLAGVTDALALVRLGRTELADDRRDLAHRLLVGARDPDLGLLGGGEGDAG